MVAGVPKYWKLLKENDGIRTMILADVDEENPKEADETLLPDKYKLENSNGIFSIRLEGIVEADFFPLLALFSEVDMFTEWVPGVMGLGNDIASSIL